ncbi:uncharacterized protein LOC106664979 [Cimex lectularius]|uniref:Gustatory receptor n=1 Tax=Cimex lectularius TaxID=79782 RepID=A0A8I6TDG3_CIMLE|nr:uncharacterized protein LOC106664979 [Cimex lectularius]
MVRKGSAAAGLIPLIILSKLFGCSLFNLDFKMSIFQIYYSIFVVVMLIFMTFCTYGFKDVDGLSLSMVNTAEVDFQYTIMTGVAILCIVRYPKRMRFLKSFLERIDRYDRFLKRMGIVVSYGTKLECFKSIFAPVYLLTAMVIESLIYGYFKDLRKMPQVIVFYDQVVISATEFEFVFLVKVVGNHLQSLRNEGKTLYQLVGCKFLMLQHIRLRGMAKEIGSFYSTEILCCLLRLFFMAVTSAHFALFYLMFNHDEKKQDKQAIATALYLFYTVYYFWELYDMCSICYWTETQNEKFNYYFRYLVISGSSKSALQDIDIRTHLAMKYSIEFDCGGYIRLKNSLFLSMVGALVTYLGFFIQKQMSAMSLRT